MMNPEVKQKWVAALRSGEYNQGQGCLRNDDDSYCCLGVLCDLYAKEQNNHYWRIDECDHMMYNFDGRLQFPPPSVWKDWAELEIDDPFVPYEDSKLLQLSSLNDDGLTFEQIADLIEENL